MDAIPDFSDVVNEFQRNFLGELSTCIFDSGENSIKLFLCPNFNACAVIRLFC